MKMVVCGLLLAVAPLAMAQGAVDRSHGLLRLQPRPAGPPVAGGWTRPSSTTARRSRADPRSAALRTELARLLREAGAEHAGARRGARGGEARPRRRGRPGVPGAAAAPRGRARRRRPSALEAATALEDVLRLRPGDETVTRALAEAYRQAGKHADAARVWEKQVEAGPEGLRRAAAARAALLRARASPTSRRRRCRRRSRSSRPRRASSRRWPRSTRRRSRPSRRCCTTARRSSSSRGNLRIRLSSASLLQRARRPEEALAEAEAVLEADAENRFGARPQGPRPARPAALRRGRRRSPTSCSRRTRTT